jgi:hypothetical protein
MAHTLRADNEAWTHAQDGLTHRAVNHGPAEQSVF